MYAGILQQADKHSISELCGVYGVSRSGYYKWMRDGALNGYERTQQRVDACVADIHVHYPMMGYRRIRDTLELQFGWKLSDPTIWRSMKRLRVHDYTRKRKLPTSYTGMQYTRYANILSRNFKADKPLQKIVTGVTYIKYRGKWFYLAAYLDFFNNEIVEWNLSDTFDNFLVMRPAERLLKKTESTEHPILLHSDQGVQYSSAGYCNLLSQYNAIQSMSRAGNPYDNAVIESFWGRFKDSLRHQFRFWERDDLYGVAAECIHYFNFIRPLRKLYGKPPVLFRLYLVPNASSLSTNY